MFAATWLSYAGFYSCRKVFGVIRGPLRDALGVSDMAVSHLWMTFLITYMIGQFVSAWLGRHLRARDTLLAGMSAAALATILTGALLRPGATTYILLLLAMAVQGFAQATGWANNLAIMTNWTSHKERGRIMAVWGTCYQLGSVAAKVQAAFLFSWLGLRWSFWGAGLVMLGLCVLFALLARESPESMGHPAPGEEQRARSRASSSGISTERPLTPAVLQRIITMGFIYFSFKFLRYSLDSWSALLAAERFGSAISTAGYLSTVFDWVGFLGVLAAGWSSDRLFGGRRTPVIFLMTTGCFLATLCLWRVGLSSLPAYCVLLGLIGFLLMGPDSLLSGPGAMDVATRRQAVVAAGVINGLGSVGPVLEEPIIAWLKTNRGIDSVFAILMIVALLSAVSTGLFWYGVRKQRIEL